MIFIQIGKAIVMAVGVVVAAVAGYWTQARSVPVASKAIEVVGPVYPGGRVLVRWQVYRSQECSADRQEIVIDVASQRWIVARSTITGPAGPIGFDTFITSTELPRDIPPGPALLRVNISYKCNPIHAVWPVVDRTPDIPIIILSAPKDT